MIEIVGYVVEVNSSFIRIITSTVEGIQYLTKNGFLKESNETYLLSIDKSFDKPSFFEKLRNQNFAFSVGREWSPSELFEHFRDNGLISGSYIRISWLNKDEVKLTIS